MARGSREEASVNKMIETSPHKRGLIIKAIGTTGEWSGRVGGVRVKFSKVTWGIPVEPGTTPNQIYYTIIVKRKRFDGYATTVWSALEIVGAKISEVLYGRKT